MTTTIFTNQVCEIKENKYLKFPKTKTLINIGKCGEVGTLKEVRIIPSLLGFTIDVVMEQKFPNEIEMVDAEVNVDINTAMQPMANYQTEEKVDMRQLRQ